MSHTTPLIATPISNDIESGSCAECREHPYGYTTRKPFPCTKVHNDAFSYGIQAMSILWYILVPLTIPFAFVAGMFVAGVSELMQSLSWQAWCTLVGEIVGRMVLEISGKRAYYDKKLAYYERINR